MSDASVAGWNVAVRYAAVSSRLVPSERVGLAVTWVANGAVVPGVIWEMALYGPQGQQLDSKSGFQRDTESVASGPLTARLRAILPITRAA